MQRLVNSGDWSGTLVALALIASDMILHVMKLPSEVFDGAIAVIVAVHITGRMVNKANGNNKPSPPSSP